MKGATTAVCTMIRFWCIQSESKCVSPFRVEIEAVHWRNRIKESTKKRNKRSPWRRTQPTITCKGLSKKERILKKKNKADDKKKVHRSVTHFARCRKSNQNAAESKGGRRSAEGARFLQERTLTHANGSSFKGWTCPSAFLTCRLGKIGC